MTVLKQFNIILGYTTLKSTFLIPNWAVTLLQHSKNEYKSMNNLYSCYK